jgi:hypothetical protein
MCTKTERPKNGSHTDRALLAAMHMGDDVPHGLRAIQVQL